MKRICVFAGSSSGSWEECLAAAQELGQALVRRQIGLVYGGARVGLMGALADAVLAAHGHVTGVIPEALAVKEVAHDGLSDLRVVASLHERKALMADLSDGFIAIPGGWGTLEEFFEVLTWAQLALHQKPCGLLNVEGFYDGLLRSSSTRSTNVSSSLRTGRWSSLRRLPTRSLNDSTNTFHPKWRSGSIVSQRRGPRTV